MSYWKALGYLGIVMQMGAALGAYLRHKNEKWLATEITEILYDMLNGMLKGKVNKRVSREKCAEAAQAVATVVKDVV